MKRIAYAIVGAVVFGVAVFGGGFLLAMILGPEAGSALGMLVPMVATPFAALVGAIAGWRKGAAQR